MLSLGGANVCPHQEVAGHPCVEFTAASPGRGSERTQCPGWRAWAPAWTRPGAPAAVAPAPALRTSESRPGAETGGGDQKKKKSWDQVFHARL